MSATIAALRSLRVTRVFMDTPVTVELVEAGADAEHRIDRAFGWFTAVERTCSRFDPESELSQLSAQAGVAVTVSPMLFAALELALTVAVASDGALDPTVGGALAAAGFDRNYRTGERVTMATSARGASYRDIALDAAARTVTLARPLNLDLGAVAKGLAIDLAARELHGAHGFAVEAGGDVKAGGVSTSGRPWRIGIRDPHRPGELADAVTLSGAALCTSGGYERQGVAGGHHLIEPATGRSPAGLASVSVIAPSAMLADALSTAVFILGPAAGAPLLAREGVAGLFILDDGSAVEAGDFGRYRP
jgi:thiamine biosynthesis lipoprotein